MSIDYKEKRRKEIVRRAMDGEVFADIARDLGISRERVRQIVKKHGNITGRELQHSGERPVKFKEFYCINCSKKILKRTIGLRKGRKFCTRVCMGEYLRKNIDVSERKEFKSQKYPRKVYKKTYIGKVNGKSKYAYTHRYIIEKNLGRKLKPTEHVHHINGNGLDNRIENLIVMSSHSHGSLTGKQMWSIKNGKDQKGETKYLKPKEVNIAA